jgi:hypothetical protein
MVEASDVLNRVVRRALLASIADQASYRQVGVPHMEGVGDAKRKVVRSSLSDRQAAVSHMEEAGGVKK